MWKYRSQNTHDNLSLHDCWCSSFGINEGKIIMEMEWMEVLSSHPDNPYSKAHQSTDGMIEFDDVSDVQLGEGDFQNKVLEVLDFDSDEIDNGFQIHINAISRSKDDSK